MRKLIAVTCWLVLAGCTIPSTPVPTIVIPTRTATFVPTATATLTFSPTFTPSPQPIPPAESGDIPNLAWFYIEPLTTPCSDLPALFSTYILTRGRAACRTAIEARGDSARIFYLRLDGWQDRDNVFGNPQAQCTSAPFQNNVAFRLGDACWIRDNHPEWALRRGDGSYIRTNDGFILSDPGNLAWRAWWIERALEMQTLEGWHGLFLDNVSASRNNAGLPLRDYPDDKTYQDAIAGFLETIRISFDTQPVQANLIYQTTSSVWYRYAGYLDAVMEESFAVNWLNGYLSVSQWQNQLNKLEQTLASGVEVIAVTQGLEGDTARQQFGYASYLLIAQRGLSFRYANAQSSGYRYVWDYPNYHYDLGQPLTGRYLLPDGTWERRYERAVVQVNPSTHEATIVLNG